MTREEAIKLLQVTKLMLMDGANQPISDLYYALDMAIEALEQTENSSEKPNNYCDDCLYTDTCDSKEFFYACTSKATISKMEQVEDDAYFLELMGAVERGEISDAEANQAWYEYINHKDEPQTQMKTQNLNLTFKKTDEPQTDCGDFANRLAYERGVKHAWEVAQKVFNSTVTFYEAEDMAKQIDKDINVRSKERSE